MKTLLNYFRHASPVLFVLLLFSSTLNAQCPGSLKFDSNNPSVDLPPGNQYYSGSNGGYTWECWFKLEAPFGSDVRPLISSVDQVTFEDMWLGFGWQGGVYNEPVTRLVFKVDGPNSQYPAGPNCSYAPTGGFVTGTWYHAAGVMDYTQHVSVLYVNGLAVDSKTVPYAPITRVIPTELSFNWNNTPLPLFGNMDEIRIWNKPLTGQQILANYNKCLAGNEAGLIVYYRCNQPGGNSVPDASPNSNNGTFNVMQQWSTDEAPVSGTACAGYVSAVASPTQKCSGTATIFTITASGASSYMWSNNAASPAFTASPSSTTIYTVTATFTGGCSGTQTVAAKVDKCTGLTEKNSEGVAVYPNPSNGQAWIKSTMGGAFQLVDACGRVVFSEDIKAGEAIAPATNLPCGLYYYTFITPNDSYSGKLLVAD
jgi:hypothetical protein